MLGLLGLAMAPVVVLLWYVWIRDCPEKEPPALLWKAFYGGVCAGLILVLFGGTLIGLCAWGSSPLMLAISFAFLGAAIPEELLKYYYLKKTVWDHPAFDEHFDGIVYAVFVSLGFACLENILYIVQIEYVQPGSGYAIGMLRAMTAVPAHFLFAVIMGYFFSLAKFRPEQRSRFLAAAVILPILAHGVYDFLLMYNNALDKQSMLCVWLNIGFVLFNIVLWKRCVGKIRHLAALSQENPYPLTNSSDEIE